MDGFKLDEFNPVPDINSFGDIVNIIVFNAFALGAIITFVLLVVGGIGVIMSAGAGDSKQLEKGKKTITGAVVGFIIIVTSYWVVQMIEYITGITLLSKPKLW